MPKSKSYDEHDWYCSGKTLAEMGMPDFCPRCWWLKQKLTNWPMRVPFPGVFTLIDGVMKTRVENVLMATRDAEGYGQLPDDMGFDPELRFRRLGRFNWQQYWVDFGLKTQSGTQIFRLRGEPDVVLECKKPLGLYIVDDKCANFTAGQDRLLPQYTVQLGSYAYIAERRGLGKVLGMFLFYGQPLGKYEGPVKTVQGGVQVQTTMGFLPLRKDVAYDFNVQIPILVKRAYQLMTSQIPPWGRKGCENCGDAAKAYKLLDATNELATDPTLLLTDIEITGVDVG